MFCSGLSREISLIALWNMSKRYSGVVTSAPIADIGWLENFANSLATPYVPLPSNIEFNDWKLASREECMAECFTTGEVALCLS